MKTAFFHSKTALIDISFNARARWVAEYKNIKNMRPEMKNIVRVLVI